MRIQKVLRDAGIASRRGVEELIEKGVVTVNGKMATIGMDLKGDENIKVRGKQVKLRAIDTERVFIAFHKPVGVVSTKAEGYDEKTVYDFLPPKYRRLNIVGRLDKASSGLILLLSDGNLVFKLTHPRFQVQKEYLVTVDKKMNPLDIESMKKGVKFEGEEYRAKRASLIRTNEVRIILTEGKKREIRNMLRALGYEVKTLQRVRIGTQQLGSLKVGEYRELDRYEVRELTSSLAK